MIFKRLIPMNISRSRIVLAAWSFHSRGMRSGVDGFPLSSF